MRKTGSIILIALFLLVSCDEIKPEYPDEPVIDYQGFGLFISVDQLGNKSLVGQLTFKFTDGDGNLGLYPLADSSGVNLPDTVKYNFFLQLYDLNNYEYEKVPEEEGGILKYRIPYLDKQPLSGTMDLEISYPVIIHDTIFYTFYIFDRAFNRSNVDTTEVIVLSGIELEEI
ncbi:MAG: hypothetical protein KAR19_20395 [Bacteroidales bacterium]|nr:hypothetical protein [Bacteroidales bacterium]